MGNVIMKNHFKSILFAFVLLASSFNIVNGQGWTHIGDGTHQFQALQQPENLSFYLFGDGYHSFKQNPRHQYGQGSIPIHYRAEPYEDDDDVEESIMDSTTETVAMPEIVNIDMEGKVMIKRSWNLVEGKKNYFILSFHNQGTTATSGCLEFHYNKDDLDISESDLLDDYGNNWVQYSDNEPSGYPFSNKYVWTYQGLQPDQQRHIYIKANCIPEAFSEVRTRFVMNVSDNNICDSHTADESHSTNLLSIVKSNPHDPNGIFATPYALFDCDIQQTINYKVYFHNDGETPAQNVFVNLEAKAPINNVKLLSASDKVSMEWDPTASPDENGIVHKMEINFLFENIYLRGAGEDPEPSSFSDTNGFVEFEVCYDLADFTDNDLIYAHFDGEIKFDYELPISIHNRIYRWIDCEWGTIKIPSLGIKDDVGFESAKQCPLVQSPAMQDNYSDRDEPNPAHFRNDLKSDKSLMEIYPNPGHDIVHIENIDLNQNGTIVIVDVKGESIKTLQLSELKGNNQINVETLNQGIYFLTVTTETQRQTKRFVKL